MKKPDLKALRQALRDFTEISPSGMTINELVDALLDQVAEMRREPENQAALRGLLQDACGTCNELFFEDDKAYRCNQLCFSTHSHQDFTCKKQAEMGDMREVEVTPQNILAEMERFFQLNTMTDRPTWIKSICKALGKPYKKSNYRN